MSRPGAYPTLGVLCAAVLVLGACEQGDPDGNVSADPPGSPSAAPDQTAPAEPPESPSAPGETSLEDLPELNFPTYTREDMLTYHASTQHLEEVLDELPELPPVIREITPDEQEDTRIACLAEYGFLVERDEFSGGTTVTWPREQTEAYWTAEYMCAAQYPLADKYVQHYNAEQLAILYDWQLQEAIPCVEGLGFMVGEPPTFETFYGEYAATGAVVWLALHHLDDKPEGRAFMAVEDACPPFPPTEVFYAPVD